MIPKRIDQIAESDLLALIANAIREGRTIEYKRELPGNADGDKKEFLADVSSFANSATGDMLFGIEEQQGLPTRIAGLSITDADAEIRRLDSILTSGVEPRLRYALQLVKCEAGPVLIMRIEKSWIGPHRVVFRGHDKFYGRSSAGKYPLDVTELRSAFASTGDLAAKVLRFREDRAVSIASQKTTPHLRTAPTLVLHVIPVESFATTVDFDVLQYATKITDIPPIRSSSWGGRINLDGFLSYSTADRSTIDAYTQLYRNGIIEAVDTRILSVERAGKRLIPYASYERALLDYLPKCFQVLNQLHASTPIIVALTLLRVLGLEMADDSIFPESSFPIEQDHLLLPEAWVNDLAIRPEGVLKPIFDIVWNACGYASSKNFDPDGNWVRRT